MHDMLENIQAVIFDLDGSMIDSMWVWKEIDIEYLARFGLELPDTLRSEIEGMSFSQTATYIKERFCIPDSTEEMMSDWNRMAWEKYTKEVPLKKGVDHFLRGCRDRGIKLGVATSNSRELAENVLRVHGLLDSFQCILTGSDIKKGKSSPDIYLIVAERLGVLPEHCLVFEDIVAGIQAGKNAGMRVCAVEDAYSAAQREEKIALADYYIEDYKDIFED